MEILLFVLIVVVSALTLAVFAVVVTFAQMSRKGKATSGVHLKKGDIEDLLSSGNAEAARADASIWRRQQPRNAAAYQLLAKAHFQLKEYVECKRVLEELIDFAPEFEFWSQPYLARVEKELKGNRPRIVDSNDS